LLLGSRWALLPGVLAAVLLVVRTALEDRTQRTALEGYADYAARVRYRLAPGIW
jgi:protein-S-isoprenylcysteine O-methyltransferase Ste14